MSFARLLVSFTAIWNCTAAWDLQCSETFDGYFAYGNFFVCEVANMQITERGEVMTSASTVTDYHKLNGVKIFHQIMNYFPKFSDELGQRIGSIYVQYSHLKAIERDDLRPFPLLKGLILGHNDLTSLPGDLFQLTPNLLLLNLNHNPLKFVGADIFKPLSNLHIAFFQSSGCIDSFARRPAEIKILECGLQTKCNPELAYALSEIESLRQEKLKLTNEIAQSKLKNDKLELKAFEDQRKLNETEKRFQEEESKNAQLRQEIGNLEVNAKEQQKKTAEVEQELQQKLRSCDRNLNSATQILSLLLAQVTLSSNHQSNVELICIRYSNETKTCNAIDFSIENSATKVVSIKDELGSEVQPTSLIIRHQAALFLPINLQEAFLDLKHLEVSSSGLFYVNRKTFVKLDKLVSLNLTSNKISSISSGSFADFKSLTSLDLSSNRLESIGAGGFDGLQSIKVLNLKDNQLKQITASFLSSIPSLDSLDLRGNSCIDVAHPETALEAIEAAINEDCVTPLKLNCTTSNDHHVCDAETLQVEHSNAKS